VAFANRVPLRGSWTSGFGIESPGNAPSGNLGRSAGSQAVSASYFRLFGIQLLSGRTLSDLDRNGVEPVAVVSQNFGATFLGGATPLGHRLRRGPNMPWIRIVGVVADIRRGGKTASLEPQVYLSAAQTNLYPPRLTELVVRSDGNSTELAPQIRAAVWALDPNQTISNIQSMERAVSLDLAERRFHTALFTLFGGLAFALAAVGIYGVVSYAAWQRRPEIGIRMALGADAGRIVRWLVGRTAMLVAAGVALGIGIALALSRLLGTLLFATPATDVVTYASAAAALAAVALGTSAAVARAATRLDPTTALRHE
jgi:putative ABC transport system permease protein